MQTTTSSHTPININVLKTVITSQKQSGNDYVTLATENLSVMNLTTSDIDDFFDYCADDHKLIMTILKTKSVPATKALSILEKIGFSEMLCIVAGETHTTDPKFIKNLIYGAYAKNANRGRGLAKCFEKHLFQMDAVELCNNVGGDPEMLRILRKALCRQ